MDGRSMRGGESGLINEQRIRDRDWGGVCDEVFSRRGRKSHFPQGGISRQMMGGGFVDDLYRTFVGGFLAMYRRPRQRYDAPM